MRNSSKHFPLAAPFTTQERNRKRKVFTPSCCVAALGTQKVATKNENARGVRYLLLANTHEYRNLQSGERLTRVRLSS